MNHWKIVQSIWQKVEAKNPQNKYGAQLTNKPTTAFPLSTRYRCYYNDGNSAHDYNVPTKYKTACIGKISDHIRFLNFNTETERYNAWQSYLTKFARFCICMDESTKLAPYMDNYTQPWDDQRFYEYFGLNKIEIQLIESVIK